MTKLYDAEGAEIEAFLPDEVTLKVSEAITAKETEFTSTKTKLEEELSGAKKALGERANQFATFRKLNDETVAKLSDAERTNYENTLALNKVNEERLVIDKKNQDSLVEIAIRAKSGTDEKLFAKMNDMWKIIGIDAVTPDQIEQKTKMILGAISTTEPDLLASVSGFSNGSFAPPKVDGGNEEKSFADTDKGKAMANELGLKLE